jgi:hypothetical protein
MLRSETDKKVKQDLVSLFEEGGRIFKQLQMAKSDDGTFRFKYQSWYSKVLAVIEFLAPDRAKEFKGYYEIDPRRKHLGYGTYVIQDYLKGVGPDRFVYPDFDSVGQVLNCCVNQHSIVQSVIDRLESSLVDIRGTIYSELLDDEIQAASTLRKINLRAAGALCGVIIERHLQNLATKHLIKMTKVNPAISDLNEALKAADVIDLSVWRKISFLGDIRNICSHKKDKDPTTTQVDDLIDGANWLTKNVN